MKTIDKTKLIFASIIAVIFIAAMVVFRQSMSLTEVILAFIGAGSTIGYLWEWFSKTEAVKEKKEIEDNFKKATGKSYQAFKLDKDNKA